MRRLRLSILLPIGGLAAACALAALVTVSSRPSEDTRPDRWSTERELPGGPSASASAKLPEPPIAPTPIKASDIPEADSPTPKLDEWGHGRRIEMDENSDPEECTATLVREWIRIECYRERWGLRPGGAIRQLAGASKGVLLFVSSNPQEGGGRDAHITMPLRRGDHRVFQMFELQMAVYGDWTTPSFIVEERWLDGEDHPTLVLR